MTDILAASSELASDIYDNRWLFWVGGALSIVFGALAILMPHIATLAAELVIGAVLAVSGVVEAVTAFKARKKSRIATRFFLGLLALAAGVLLLIDPLSGIFALTIVLTAFFLASGILKLLFCLEDAPPDGMGLDDFWWHPDIRARNFGLERLAGICLLGSRPPRWHRSDLLRHNIDCHRNRSAAPREKELHHSAHRHPLIPRCEAEQKGPTL